MRRLTVGGGRDDSVPTTDFQVSSCIHICCRPSELVTSSERSIMRAGTISLIVIPFLLASLAASGLVKSDHREGKKDCGPYQPPQHQQQYLDCWLKNERKHNQSPPNHESADKPPKPTSKPPPPPKNPGQTNGIENPKILWMDNSVDDESNKSTCLYDLRNETCSQSLYCVITKPAKPNENPVQRDCQNQAIILSVKNRTKCLQICFNETAANLTQCGNLTYHFYPIDLPCNTIKVERDKVEKDKVEVDIWDLLETYKYPIAGGALGIISLLILIICIVCTVKKKRKNSEKCYDIPMQSDNHQDCMVENNLYSS